MVSLFSRFVTGGVVALPVIDPRLIAQDDTPVVVSPEEGPAAPKAEPLEAVAPEFVAQTSTAPSAPDEGDGTLSPT